MSVSFSCRCPERKKPIESRVWVVLEREHNNSAFNGYHYTSSDYSLVYCRFCGALGRTKAKYVKSLKDAPISVLSEQVLKWQALKVDDAPKKESSSI
jgi:late competence protein required for DNA uptake (superfamily II DNA/RNA helicase)